MNIVIPMAGLGSRFQLNGNVVPKPLIKINDKYMVEVAIKSLNLEGQYIFVTRKYGNEYDQILNDILKKIKPDCIIHQTDSLTKGSASTCLLVEQYINNDSPLLITNCDQYVNWDSNDFLTTASLFDACVVTYKSNDPKNSFVKLNDNTHFAELFVEKTVISNDALVGIHYWKQGSDFVNSATRMINQQITTNGEYYIAPTYNQLVEAGKKINIYKLNKEQYYSLGTPDDLKVYLGKLNEYSNLKPKTIICDIDGTILKHMHAFSKINEQSVLLPGVS